MQTHTFIYSPCNYPRTVGSCVSALLSLLYLSANQIFCSAILCIPNELQLTASVAKLKTPAAARK